MENGDREQRFLRPKMPKGVLADLRRVYLTVDSAHVLAYNPNHSPCPARPRYSMRLTNALHLSWHGERRRPLRPQ